MSLDLTTNWNVSPTEAVALQRRLQGEVLTTPLDTPINYVAGVDVSLNMFSKDIYAGVIVLSYPDMTPVAHAVIQDRTEFPYIPGLLSFREIPALMKCFEKLFAQGLSVPDVILVDGQGIAHPRRLGIATHLGILLDMPTIGVGKSRLYGTYQEPVEVGEAQPITDPKTGDVIGTAYKSKVRSKPLIISPGHKTSVEDALEIVKTSLRGYRLPEPTRLAHQLVNAFRTGEIKE